VGRRSKSEIGGGKWEIAAGKGGKGERWKRVKGGEVGRRSKSEIGGGKWEIAAGKGVKGERWKRVKGGEVGRRSKSEIGGGKWEIAAGKGGKVERGKRRAGIKAVKVPLWRACPAFEAGGIRGRAFELYALLPRQPCQKNGPPSTHAEDAAGAACCTSGLLKEKPRPLSCA